MAGREGPGDQDDEGVAVGEIIQVAAFQHDLCLPVIFIGIPVHMREREEEDGYDPDGGAGDEDSGQNPLFIPAG